jgi:hypothetical protein
MTLAGGQELVAETFAQLAITTALHAEGSIDAVRS